MIRRHQRLLRQGSIIPMDRLSTDSIGRVLNGAAQLIWPGLWPLVSDMLKPKGPR